MVDLSIIYSKTGKGLRARNASISGLSAKQLNVLTFVNGKSTAEVILTQSNEITEKELAATLSQLEANGFIRPLAAAQSNADNWALTSNFTPMVVEEFKSEEEIEAEALAKAEAKVAQEKLDADYIAAEKAKEKIRWKAEISARKAAQAIEKARLEQERNARAAEVAQKKQKDEQKKRDDAAHAKAKAENESQLEAVRKAKAEQKAKDEAEQAKLQAEQERLETARINKIEQVRLEAERIAKAENEAQLEAARKAKAEQKAQEAAELARIKLAEKAETDAVAKEAGRLEITRIIRKAEEERKLAETAAKEARHEAKRQIKAEEQARNKAARKAKDEGKQARINAEAAEKNKIALQQAAQLAFNRLEQEAKNAKSLTKNIKVEQAINEVAINHDAAINQAQQAPLQSDLLANKIAEQQAELQAEEERKIAIEQANAADLALQLATQLAQEKAEQIRAKNEVDEKVASEAKELARQEMARIAREADALRSQADRPSLTKPTKSGRFEASRAAKLKKSTVQAEKNAKNLADTQTREAEKRAYIAITGKQSAAKQQEEIKTPIKAKHLTIDLSSILFKGVKWMAKLVRTTLVVGFILALLLIGILHFVNISPLIAPIEKLASESLGKPVHIKQVRASLWPQPHLVLGEVAFGDTLKAASLQVVPDAATLFDAVKRVKSLTISGLTIEQSHAQDALQLIQILAKAPSIKVEQLSVSDLSFKLKDLMLGPFDGKMTLTAANALNIVNLHSADNALTAQIKPQGEDYAVTLTGNYWPLLLNPNIVFDELKANARIHQNQMIFSQIDGAIFGGKLSAKAVLDWSGDWHATGNFTLTNANSAQLLKAFASKASVDGKVNVSGDFASQSAEALKLTNTPTISASIALKNGKINGVDLAHAVMFNQNASLAGEATAFDKLTANLQAKDGQYHYKQILLNTKQFHANGNLDIGQNQAISGKVNAVVNAQSRRLQADFNLGGTIDHVKRQ